MKLSHKLDSVNPSLTLEITGKAQALRAQGKSIISLSAGEPDFQTPDHVKQAAIQAIHDNHTTYTAVDGIPTLKQAIQKKFKNQNQLDYALENICACVGAKQPCYHFFQAALNPEDEVIIPAPFWVSYPDMVKLAGGKPVVLACGIEQNFKLKPQQLEQAITPQTKALIINSPSNPSGAVYDLEELAALGEVLLKHPNVLILSDDIYEHIILGDEPKFTNILNACPALKDRTLVVNGVSKAYAMTGWRMGYAAGPVKLIKAMKLIQGQSTSNPTSITQHAAIAALNGPQHCLTIMRNAFKQRHDLLYKKLSAAKGFTLIPSSGSFYSFIDVSTLIQHKGLADDLELASDLLDRGVALVPGSGFGMPGHVRISFATSDALLEEALNILIQYSNT